MPPPPASLPRAFGLAQNYPNPFNPETAIRFHLTRPGEIRLEVYDITGRMVVRLIDGRREAGEHGVVFNGAGLPSGIYLYRLTAEGKHQVKRMLLLR
ncbi:MAG: hypothetical protein BWY77_01914 [bacterium ADurb.Bin431]|nr:MAG: hypothetical protein BWY77_01914 [bacterium ADurb.Bin431]